MIMLIHNTTSLIVENLETSRFGKVWITSASGAGLGASFAARVTRATPSIANEKASRRAKPAARPTAWAYSVTTAVASSLASSKMSATYSAIAATSG